MTPVASDYLEIFARDGLGIVASPRQLGLIDRTAGGTSTAVAAS